MRDQMPMPSGGTWSGSRPTAWPARSALIIWRTPASVVGTALRAGRLRAVAISWASQASVAYWQTVGLLLLSNVFMTFAWYGHLKHLNSKDC